VQMLVQANCNDIISTNAQGMVSATLPPNCALHLPHEQVARAVAAVRTAPDLEFDLTRWLSNLRQKVIQFQLVSNNARQLVDTMDDPPQ
jgi:hypothetical protein